MDDQHLIWKTNGKRPVYHTRVFDVNEKDCVSSDGRNGTFFVMDAVDWVITIPVIGDRFVVVRQWRHGEEGITMEFPGGCVDKGEDPDHAAMRELEEEIACHPKRLIRLGSVNPNPALFTNHLHVYLAEDLTPLESQHLDDDEYVDYCEVPIKEFIE